MSHKNKIKTELNLLIDVFAATDSGVNLIYVKIFLEEMARRADKGDVAAVKILDMVYQFNKLIDFAIANAKKSKKSEKKT